MSTASRLFGGSSAQVPVFRLTLPHRGSETTDRRRAEGREALEPLEGRDAMIS